MSAWEKVDVRIGSGAGNSSYSDEAEERPSSSWKSDNVANGEHTKDVGMFYQLERIDGSKYKIEKDEHGNSIMKILSSREESTASGTPSETDTTVSHSGKKKRKKRSRSKANESTDAMVEEKVSAKENPELSPIGERDSPVSEKDIEHVQKKWMLSSGGVILSAPICRVLHRNNWLEPTPIQSTTLAPAILGKRNIVGAAPTGSGKTLSFLLPILTFLHEEKDENNTCLRALIITPTRELAFQIQHECQKFHEIIGKTVVTIVGGLAQAKQQRLLKKNAPIVIATPGRLWDMISSQDYEHLNDLSQLRFLVIDEADRMIQRGSFEELEKILDVVQAANSMDDDEDDTGDGDLNDDDPTPDDPTRLLGLPGIRGEAKLQMLSDDILAAIEKERESDPSGDIEKLGLVQEEEEDFFPDNDDGSGTEDEISLPTRPPVHRQTFVYSATLTLPSSGKFIKSKRRLYLDKNVDGAIAEILEKSRAKGKTKVIDLTNADKSGKRLSLREVSTGTNAQKFQLPPGLVLQQIRCSQMHKDSHLYAYLTITDEGREGPVLVFCNSIPGVRRVTATLQLLGIKVKQLHAQMKQKTRFKTIEALKNSPGRVVVVATDVAARGIDITDITAVVNYDVPRSIDTFIHRSGRTARGVGSDATGFSVSLVSPSEEKPFAKIAENLQVSFEGVPLDGRLFSAAQERVNLATKVLKAREIESKRRHNNDWFKSKALEAGIEIEEDLLEDSLSSGSKKDRSVLKSAEQAADRLSKLLKEPLRPQRFGKFLPPGFHRNDPEATGARKPKRLRR